MSESTALSLTKLIENPIVHVNRTDFLAKLYDVSETDIRLNHYSIDFTERKRLAKKRINWNVNQSAMASTLTGIPGGITLAATIPADILQNMMFSLRLVQELAYIYDYDDVINKDGMLDIDGVIVFLGIMVSAQGAGSLLRVISSNGAKYTVKKIGQTALTKTMWYPLLKKIYPFVTGRMLTKAGLAKGATKVIPILGGVASGGITYITMTKSATRLNTELLKGYGNQYSKKDFDQDIKIINAQFEEL